MQNTPRLNKNCATTHSFITLTNVDRFLIFFTIVFAMKFATKSMSYVSPHFKGVTPLPCKTWNTETGKILLHATHDSCLMFTKLTNMTGKTKYALYGVKLNVQNFILSHECPQRDVCATYHLRHWWHRWGKCSSRSAKSWRRWTEAAFDWCLAWLWAKCHQCVKVRNFEHSV